MPFAPDHPTSAHLMPVLLPAGADRAAVWRPCGPPEVQTSVHYPAIHQFTYYRRRFGDVRLPHTEAFSRPRVDVAVASRAELG